MVNGSHTITINRDTNDYLYSKWKISLDIFDKDRNKKETRSIEIKDLSQVLDMKKLCQFLEMIPDSKSDNNGG